jgi:hypothetical protein
MVSASPATTRAAVAEALADIGVVFFGLPTCGVRLKPSCGDEFRD